MHPNLDRDALGKIDALQIDVQQVLFHRIALPIDNHGRRIFAALHREIEYRVVSGIAVQNPVDFFRTDGDSHGRLPAPYRTAGAKPFTRSRRASFLPRVSRGSALTVISFLMLFSLRETATLFFQAAACSRSLNK